MGKFHILKMYKCISIFTGICGVILTADCNFSWGGTMGLMKLLIEWGLATDCKGLNIIHKIFY